MNKEEAQQVFDGVMLGDGGLVFMGSQAHFVIGNADNKEFTQREQIPVEDLLEFLQHLAEVFRVLGVEPCAGHPKIIPNAARSLSGKKLNGCIFETKGSLFLTDQYHRWYKGGEPRHDKKNRYYIADAEKVVSKGFKLTPLSLAYWFMLDGRSVWTNGISIDAGLCSYSFGLNSIKDLEEQLHSFGLSTSRNYRKAWLGKGKPDSNIQIAILQNSIDSFMSIMMPHMVAPYLYKIKYRGSCPTELASKYRERNREYSRRSRERKHKGMTLFNDLRSKLEK